MEKQNHPTTISSSLGDLEVTFENNPLIRVHISLQDAFLGALEEAWNSRPLGRDDPHSHLVEILANEQSAFAYEEQERILSEFLLAAATALRHLDEGRTAECSSLEHHALALKQKQEQN